MEIACIRLNRRIDEHTCCQLIVDTQTREELHVCRTCGHGHSLAELCPFHERFAEDMPPVVQFFLPEVQEVQDAAEVQEAKQKKPPATPKKRGRPKAVKPQPEPPKPVKPRKPFVVQLMQHLVQYYPGFKTHGMNFVHNLALARFSYAGCPETLKNALLDRGLRIVRHGKREALIMDDAAKAVARQ